MFSKSYNHLNLTLEALKYVFSKYKFLIRLTQNKFLQKNSKFYIFVVILTVKNSFFVLANVLKISQKLTFVAFVYAVLS